MSRFVKTITLIGILSCGISCSEITASETEVQTLYRNSSLDPSMRIHVATFDTSEGGKSNPDYNRAACSETAKLYRDNDIAKKDWWCEKGRFRP